MFNVCVCRLSTRVRERTNEQVSSNKQYSCNTTHEHNVNTRQGIEEI